jgi:hypothetical protein
MCDPYSNITLFILKIIIQEIRMTPRFKTFCVPLFVAGNWNRGQRSELGDRVGRSL